MNGLALLTGVLSLLVGSVAPSSPLRVHAWQLPVDGPQHSPTFPESALKELSGTTNSALCLSGGGSRAYTAALGLLGGLRSSGFERLRYLTGVSGGSWAATGFSYLPPVISDREYLGELTDPSNLTMEALGRMGARCGRRAATLSVLDHAIGYFADPLVPDDQFWIRAVSTVFLESMGVPHDAHFTWSQDTKQEILRRNPDLQNATWVVVHNSSRPRPFPIVSSTMMGPTALAPYDIKTLFAAASTLEMTPLYIGHWRALNVNYSSLRTSEVVPVGGLVEPIGFSGQASNLSGLNGQLSGELVVPSPETPFTVGYMPGTSSWEFGSVLGTLKSLDWMLKLENPRVEYWSPVGESNSSTEMYLSDGGNIENLGLIGIIQRRVNRIVIHVSTAAPLALRSRWDPSKPGGLSNLTNNPTNTFIDSDITGYFGVGADSGTGFNYSRNQVFSQSDFVRLANTLQDAQIAGDGAVALLNMTTIGNPHWAIPPGLRLQVLWIYVGRVLNWEGQLPNEVRRHVVPEGAEQDPSIVISSGPFKNFPNYATDHLQLSTEQANLLADLTGWIAIQHSDSLARMIV